MQGRRFADRYELRSPLGKGGMAEVWQAWDSRLERSVAVKILDQVGLADPAGIERFRREALAVARIAHPNIVAGYDFGTEDGRPYLVMELVAGQTLAARLAEGPLPVPEVVRIASQACAALDAAHRAGVVHRDIKPGNLIVAGDGTVKVLDFGIARLQDAANQAALTRTATVVGTSHYMAPEQATGGTADARTDLYALGCVLYALLTGVPPFEGENPMGVLYQHLHNPPRPVRESRPEVPPALEQLVMGLLAKDPGERPGSAAEVRGSLEGLETATGTGAGAGAVPGGTAVMPAAAPGTGMPAGRAAVPRPAMPAAATGVMPEADPDSTAGPRRVLGLVAAVVGVIVVAFVVLALLPEGERSPGMAQTTSSPTGSPTPSPTPEEPSPTATDPAGRLAELRAVLADQAAAGNVDPEAARKLGEELDKVAEEIDKDDLDKAAEKADEFGRKLDEEAREGRVDDGAYQELSASLNRLREVLGQPGGGDDEDGGDKGKGNGRGKDKEKGDD